MICYETDRLQVRHLTPDNLDELAALCADPVAMQYMGDGNTLTREQCAAWIEVCQMKYRERGYGTSGIFEKDTGVFVGFCGVVRTPQQTFDEIIYALAPAYWGRGYATEAARGMLDYVFEQSDLTEIYATIHADNTASIRMMQKLGLTFVEDRIEDDEVGVTKVFARRRDSNDTENGSH